MSKSKKPKISPRPPPSTAKAAFVHGGTGKAKERLTVYVSPSLLLKAEHAAVDLRWNMSRLTERALELALRHPEQLPE